MSEFHLPDQADRIGQLERELGRLRLEARWSKRLGAAVLLGIVSVAGIGGAAAFLQVPDVVVARRFVMVDPVTNKERIILGFNSAGSACISLNDEDGGTHVFLSAARNGEESDVQIFDIDKQRKVILGVSKNGQGLNINGKGFP